MNNLLAVLMKLQREHPEARVLQMREIKILVEALVPPEDRGNREVTTSAMTQVVDALTTILSQREEIPFDASTSISLTKEVATVILDEPEKIRDVVGRLEGRDKGHDKEVVGRYTQAASLPDSQGRGKA